MPLISIIIPCHNVEKYLNACLNSVTNQTYSNIEIICVEDHSVDGTWKVLQDWSKKDKRIKLYQLTNTTGVSCARNLGIRVSKGEYINFVDSDDIVSINGLKDMYHMSKAYNYPIVGEQASTIDEYEMIDNELRISNIERIISYDIESDPDKLNNISPSVWGKLYKREAIKDFFIENCIWEDYDFITKTIVKSKKFIIGLNILEQNSGYFYRRNPNGITKSLQVPGPKNLDAITIVKSILQGLKSYYKNDIFLKIAIQDKIRQFLYMNLNLIYKSNYLSKEVQKELGDLLQIIYQYHFPQLYYQDYLKETSHIREEIQFFIRSLHSSNEMIEFSTEQIRKKDYLDAKQKFLTRAKEIEIERK